jgi:hypothetical protein
MSEKTKEKKFLKPKKFLVEIIFAQKNPKCRRHLLTPIKDRWATATIHLPSSAQRELA